MQVYVQAAGLKETVDALGAGAANLAAGSPRVREAFETVGALELEAQRREYLDRSRGGETRGVRWRPLSPFSILMRRTGRTAKAASWQEIVDLAGATPILADTGRLMASLAPGAAGNVLQIGDLAVTLGTNVDYAERMSEGGAGDSPPIATRADADRLVMRRLLKVLPGPRPRMTVTGRSTRAKRHWNPEFFRVRGWLRKLAGRVFLVPARPVLTQPPEERLVGYGERLKRAILDALGLGGGQ
jgi:hypothetical protein